MQGPSPWPLSFRKQHEQGSFCSTQAQPLASAEVSAIMSIVTIRIAS